MSGHPDRRATDREQAHHDTDTADGFCPGTGYVEQSDFSVASAARMTVRLQARLADVPAEVSKPADCDQTSDLYPVPGFNLAGALKPYAQVKIGVSLVSLAKLKKGKSITATAKPIDRPDGYSAATCNGSPPCTGALSKFVSRITVKRVS